MKLERLPSVIREHEFNTRGLVKIPLRISAKVGFKLLVPAYVGSQLGFNTPGLNFLAVFYPRLQQEAGVLPLCPFKACSEYLDFSKLSDDMPLRQYREFWEEFNQLIGPVNYETLMPCSKFMIALFDGSHAVDDGLSAEVGFYATSHKPIIGIRSDFRLSENISATINPAVRYFIDSGIYPGQFFDGPNAYERAHAAIKTLADKFRVA